MDGDTGELYIHNVPAGRIGTWRLSFALAGVTLRAAGTFATAWKSAGVARARLTSKGERPSPRSPGSPGTTVLIEGTISELTSARLVLTNVREIGKATTDVSG